MRTEIPAFLIGLLIFVPSLVQARAPTNRISCAEAVELVKREGVTTFVTIGGASERVVRDRGFCEIQEIAELRFIATRDNPQCPVGYRCREPDYENWNWE